MPGGGLNTLTTDNNNIMFSKVQVDAGRGIEYSHYR